LGTSFVLKEMLKRDWLLGGESSGHIICNDITSTGDGIVSALQALTAVINTERPLLDLRSQMRKLPQSMINVRLTNTFDLDSNQTVKSAVADIEEKLVQGGGYCLRPSGQSRCSG
jgi:phosphoglucosamine mutase